MLESDRERLGSPDRFGYSWSIFRQVLPGHREQFLRWTSALPREAWRSARFLDAGCGIGRNSHWAMTEGAAGGLAIDIDERSLDAARENLARHPGIEIRHQSIYEISEENAFDIAFSIGVLHHLEDPEAATARLVRAIKPGGNVLIWVYGCENMTWFTRLFDPLRKRFLSRMPLKLVYHLSLYATVLLWFALRLGLSRIEYYRLLRTFSFAHLRAIVFDQMIPRIAHYWPREKAEQLLHGAGLDNVTLVHVNEMSWSAAGRKPPM